MKLPVKQLTGLAGLHANRPAAAEGQIYYPTDGLVPFVSDGSTWRPVIGPGALGAEPPAASNFSKLGSSTYALSDVGGSLEIASSSAEANDDVWQHSSSLGSTFDAQCAYTAAWNSGGGGSETMFALAFRTAASGKFYRWGIYWSANVLYLQLQYFTTINTASTLKSTTVMTGRADAGGPFWLRVVKNSSNIVFYYSTNGRAWVQAYSEAKDLHCVPDKWGLFMNKSNACSAQILSLVVT